MDEVGGRPEAGLAAVFLANRHLVRRLVTARTQEPAEAEDVLQEMWLRLEGARIGPVGDPLAYLMRMAMNVVVDRRRADQRRAAREEAWGATQPVGSEHPDAERRLLSVEALARLEALLDSMPEHMHRALVLFRVEGRSQRAIAAELGMTLSGVEKLLARAYRRLVEFRMDNMADAAAHTDAADDRSKPHG